MAVTTYEKGIEKGREDTLRRTVLRLLEGRFSPLRAEVRERVQRMPSDELERIVDRFATAQSLEDLGL